MLELENGSFAELEAGLVKVAFPAKEVSRTPLLSDTGRTFPYHITVSDLDPSKFLAVKWLGTTYAPDDLMVAWVSSGNIRPGMRVVPKGHKGGVAGLPQVKRQLFQKPCSDLRPGDEFYCGHTRSMKTVLTTVEHCNNTLVYTTDGQELFGPMGGTAATASCCSSGIAGVPAKHIQEGWVCRVQGKDYRVRAVYKEGEGPVEIRFVYNQNAYFFQPNCPVMVVCRNQVNKPVDDPVAFMQIGYVEQGDEVIKHGVLKMAMHCLNGYCCKFESSKDYTYSSADCYVWARPMEWRAARVAVQKIDSEINKLLDKSFKDAPQLEDASQDGYALLHFPGAGKVVLERK